MPARGRLLGRSTLTAAAALAAATVVLLALLLPSGATGSDAGRCTTYWLQSQARERMTTGQGPRVVVLGDSYAVGLGLRKAARSWPSRLPGRVSVHGFSGSGFGAAASPCPGASYAERGARLPAATADLVVIEGGLNDHDQPDAAVRAGFRAVVGGLVDRLGPRRVLVVGPPEAPARATAAREVDALLREESARAGVGYVSMTGRRFDYLEDDLHLTPSGHRAFGGVVGSLVAARTSARSGLSGTD